MFRYIKIDLFSGALFLIIASPNHHSAQNHERQQVVAYDTIQPNLAINTICILVYRHPKSQGWIWGRTRLDYSPVEPQPATANIKTENFRFSIYSPVIKKNKI